MVTSDGRRGLVMRFESRWFRVRFSTGTGKYFNLQIHTILDTGQILAGNYDCETFKEEQFSANPPKCNNPSKQHVVSEQNGCSIRNKNLNELQKQNRNDVASEVFFVAPRYLPRECHVYYHEEYGA